MKILETQVFRGPSVYSLNPVIRMRLDIEDMEERPSNLIEGFTDRLMEMMPTLYEHRCSEGVRGRLPHAAARRHMGGPHRRAHRAGIAMPGRDGSRLRQDALY